MRKLVVLALSVFLTLGFAGLSLAEKKNEREPLVEVVPGGCTYESAYTFTGSDTLTAMWSAVDGEQTKFGGGVKFKVFNVEMDGEPLEDQLVEVGLTFDPALAGMEGYFLYTCTMGDYGDCTAELINVQEAIKKEIEGAEYGQELYDYDGAVAASATFLGVYVKGMNPSVKYFGKKRQNFPLVDVCELDLPIVVTPAE